MKKLLLIPLCAALLFTGCASLQNIEQTLGTPAQVQADLTIVGGIAKPHIPASAQLKIHQFAAYLSQASDLDLTSLFALIPPTGSQNADALIAAAKAYLTSIVQKYGSHNATAIAYGHAVANGLLANF